MPPSAELRPNQTDQDSLPDYELLDRILERCVIDNLTRAEIVADVLRRVGLAEYRRCQAPTILKVSARTFGTGRRFPIAGEIHEVS